ncbi:phytoene desaturase family protein [Angustibacter sp. McL0619]|uniref:phytoene desaturase family protein n=1 Tax=Angustibacter sp. McL0619 TaxID=3415676 RepID=UPI003CEDF89C
MARIVVVGAGMGGLAVAARLSAQRHEVTVIEQGDTIGGKLGWFARDGFAFDTGPSLLTLPATYRDLFLKTGEPLERSVELVEVDPVCRYRFADGTWLDLPNASRGRTVAAMDAALGAGAGAQWASLMDHAGAVWEITRGPFLESPLDGARTLVGLSRRTRDLVTVAPWRTLRGLGRRYLRDPRLAMMLDRYATYSGSDPRRAPAALVTVPYVEQTFGAWYVRGGLRRLGDALHQRVLDTGAQVLTSSRVSEVLVESGRVGGVLLASGRRVDADVVVSDVDATHLYEDLVRVPEADKARRGLARTTPSLSGFVMLLALRGRTPDLAHHTVLFPEDYDDEFDSVFGSGRHAGAPRTAPDPTVYVSAPDDPTLRPDDQHESLFVLVNAARHSVEDPTAGIDWDAPGLASGYADRILQVMAERGLDVRDRVVWRELRTPADLARTTASDGGSIYGSSSNGVRSAFLRPANRSPVPGLFLVGGSAHPGGGLPLVAMSAAIVAEQIGRA